MDYKFELNAKSKYFGRFQTIYQSALNFGGNEDPSKTYFEKNGNSNLWWKELGWQNKR
jgi:hypothetical protein